MRARESVLKNHNNFTNLHRFKIIFAELYRYVQVFILGDRHSETILKRKYSGKNSELQTQPS